MSESSDIVTTWRRRTAAVDIYHHQPQLGIALGNSCLRERRPSTYDPASKPIPPHPHNFTDGDPLSEGGVRHPIGIAHAIDFQHDAFSCFEDVTVCLEGWLCGYCQVSSQYNYVNHGKADVHWPICVGMAGLDFCCGLSGIALCVGTMLTREKIRERYHIEYESSDCDDCCVSVFCTPCAIVQQYREMTTRGEWPGGILVNRPALEPPMGIVNLHPPTHHVYAGSGPGAVIDNNSSLPSPSYSNSTAEGMDHLTVSS